MKAELKRKYIAIKLKGMNHYIWFETNKTSTETGVFIGKGGCAKAEPIQMLNVKLMISTAIFTRMNFNIPNLPPLFIETNKV
jgi:hypothetical protein